MSVPVPMSLDGLTPDWLSAALSWGREPVRVTSVALDRRLDGTATKALVRLTYDPATPTTLPTRLCVKGGYSPEGPRIIGTGAYAAEARFYRDVRPLLSVRVPDCWFAEVDERTQQGICLLEDLSATGATFGYAPYPLEADEVAHVLEVLAALHAPWWNSPKLDAYPWIAAPIAAGSSQERFLRQHTPESVGAWLAKPRAAGVPRGITGERVVAAFWERLRRVAGPPTTLLHGDCHLGNLYLDGAGNPGLLDWQTVWRGCWSHDVGYLITSALAVEDRRRDERELLDHYRESLAGHGVAAPTADEAWRAYRESIAYGLLIWVINPPAAQPDEVNEPYITRFAAAADDLETFRALGV